MEITAVVGITSAWAVVEATWPALTRVAAESFVTSLWQTAAMACGLAICLKLAPRIDAGRRFFLWVSAFVVAACLPVLPMIEYVQAGIRSDLASNLGQAATRPWIQLDIRWSLAISGLWAFASILRAVDLIGHSIRLRMLWKSATPIEVSERLSSSLADLGRPRVEVCSAKMLERPSVIGFFAPRILIPDWLLTRLTAGELEQIVLHEAEHLRRRDDWTNLLQKLSLVFFPLNPALWWMENRLCREREMACDEGVVRLTNAPRAYAACLASLAERGLERRAKAQALGALSLGAWQRRSELVHRVHGILFQKHTLNPITSGTLLGTLGCALVIGAVELAQCPQLIAFVPRQQVQDATTITPALGQADPAPAPEAASDTIKSGGVAPRYYAVQAKAVMPGVREPKPSLVRMQKPIRKEPSSDEMNVVPAASKQIVAKAAEHGVLKNDGVEQWIVFAAWEQVQIEDRHGVAVSDYGAGYIEDSVTHDASEQGNGQIPKRSKSQVPENRGPGNQVRNQITVMQLIFKVLPTGSIPAQPDAPTVRSGWFFIQL